MTTRKESFIKLIVRLALLAIVCMITLVVYNKYINSFVNYSKTEYIIRNYETVIGLQGETDELVAKLDMAKTEKADKAYEDEVFAWCINSDKFTSTKVLRVGMFVFMLIASIALPFACAYASWKACKEFYKTIIEPREHFSDAPKPVSNKPKKVYLDQKYLDRLSRETGRVEEPTEISFIGDYDRDNITRQISTFF